MGRGVRDEDTAGVGERVFQADVMGPAKVRVAGMQRVGTGREEGRSIVARRWAALKNSPFILRARWSRSRVSSEGPVRPCFGLKNISLEKGLRDRNGVPWGTGLEPDPAGGCCSMSPPPHSQMGVGG